MAKTKRSRNLHQRSEIPFFYIICEGETEFFYMSSIKNFVNSKKVRLKIINKKKTDINNLLKLAKNQSFDKTLDKKFILLDADTFIKKLSFLDNKVIVSLDEYKTLCSNNKIELIDSMPDFESWIDMHFTLPRDANSFRKNVYQKGKPEQLDKILLANGSIITAINNANKTKSINNYSNMYLLLREIKAKDLDFESNLLKAES